LTEPPGPNALAIALLCWHGANQAATFPVKAPPLGVVFDDANIWVTGGISITKLAASDGATLGTSL